MNLFAAIASGGLGGLVASALAHFLLSPLEKQREAEFEISRLLRTYRADFVTFTGVNDRPHKASQEFKEAAGRLLAASALWSRWPSRSREEVAELDQALHRLASGVYGLSSDAGEDRWRAANLRDLRTVANALKLRHRGVTDLEQD